MIPKLKKRFYLSNNVDSNNDISLPNASDDQGSGNELMDMKYRSEGNECNFNANSILKVNEIQCQQCKEMVTNRATSLNYHVNMK